MLSYGTSLITLWCLSLSPCTPFISAYADEKVAKNSTESFSCSTLGTMFSDQVLLQVRGAGLTPWLIAASVVPGEFLERPTDG